MKSNFAFKDMGAVLILLLIWCFAHALSAYADNAVYQGYIHVIPKDTMVPITITSTLSSEIFGEQTFSAKTREPLNVDGATVIPAGSLVEGRIVQTRADSPKHHLIVGFVCDSITAADNNIRRPIVADVATVRGLLKVHRGLKYFAIAKQAGDSVFGSSNAGSNSSNLHSWSRFYDPYQVPRALMQVPIKGVFTAKEKFDL